MYIVAVRIRKYRNKNCTVTTTVYIDNNIIFFVVLIRKDIDIVKNTQ